MKFYISVVSHEHHHIIENLDSLRRLAVNDNVTVICRDNLPTKSCQEYCESNNIIYQKNTKVKGFSANNNANYIHARNELGMSGGDYFILMNPDVLIDQKNIKKLLQSLERHLPDLAAPCLFIDAKQKVFDDNLRKYPKLKNFVKNYLLKDRSTVINKLTEEPEVLDYWVSASFLCVRSKVYEKLEGFDESYHMYCEDVDFCLRALQEGYKPRYLSLVKATHFRRCYSQKFLSRPFFWHVKSVFLYSLAKKNLRRHKSVLTKQSISCRCENNKPAIQAAIDIPEVGHKLS
ncbi:glycosyltransferase [Marinomonas shanghaiensis]|uniref:glycosyltransferase n=1 Tax=Marinomonas shanghaiensis TaxID=2202418 RepID=UPI003A8E8625